MAIGHECEAGRLLVDQSQCTRSELGSEATGRTALRVVHWERAALAERGKAVRMRAAVKEALGRLGIGAVAIEEGGMKLEMRVARVMAAEMVARAVAAKMAGGKMAKAVAAKMAGGKMARAVKAARVAKVAPVEGEEAV